MPIPRVLGRPIAILALSLGIVAMHGQVTPSCSDQEAGAHVLVSHDSHHGASCGGHSLLALCVWVLVGAIGITMSRGRALDQLLGARVLASREPEVVLDRDRAPPDSVLALVAILRT